MFTQLLTSKPKTKLLNLLLNFPKRAFSMTELRLSSGCSSQSLKETMKDLVKTEFVIVVERGRVKYYRMNRQFNLYPELVGLLQRSKAKPEDILAKAASKMAECKLVVLTGLFAGKPRVETDLLFVGKASGAKLKKVLEFAERLAEQEISYTIFDQKEYDYRHIMNDRFLKSVMENEPVVVIDKMKKKK